MNGFTAWFRERRIARKFPRQSDLAHGSNVSLSTIQDIETKGRIEGRQRSTVELLAKALGVSADELLERSKGEFVDKSANAGRGVQGAGELRNGMFEETFDGRHSEGNIELPLPLEWYPNCVAARIKGDSMRPLFYEGEWVILKRCDFEQVRDGGVYYVEMDDGRDFGGTLKRVIVQGDKLLLLPVNSGNYEPMTVACESLKKVALAIGKYVPMVPNFGFDARRTDGDITVVHAGEDQ